MAGVSVERPVATMPAPSASMPTAIPSPMDRRPPITKPARPPSMRMTTIVMPSTYRKMLGPRDVRLHSGAWSCLEALASHRRHEYLLRHDFFGQQRPGRRHEG